MANTIQIKRGTTCSSTLAEGELGYNLSKNILYIGNNGNKAIGGSGAFLPLSGGTMTGPLSTTQLTVNRPDNDYPTINFIPKSRNPSNSSFIQTNTNGTFGFYSYHSDQDTDDDAGRYYTGYTLPEPTAGLNAENVTNGKGITYEILTDKKAVTIAQGGTGQNMSTTPANALIRMSSTGTFWYTPSANGAVYATSANGAITFGTLPIPQGGTGATTASAACSNLGAVKKSGDTMTGILKVANNLQVYGDGWRGIGFEAPDGKDRASIMISDTNVIHFNVKETGATYADRYKLPNPTANKTAENWYDILTTKNTVTVAQGGTGASTRLSAIQNLFVIGANPITSTTNDTTAKWKELGIGQSFYSKTGQLTNQPATYGMLLNFVYSADIFQIWSSQSSGPVYWRTGNNSGWGTNWTKFYDVNNKPTAAELGVLSLSGGTMTGTITLAATGLKTSNTAGFSTNQYGNFIHQSTTANQAWCICANNGTANFKVAYESGAVTSGAITSSGAVTGTRLQVYSSSDYPTLAFKRNSDTQEHAFIQTGTDGKFGFYGYNADQVDADTHFYEGYALPTPNTSLTANTTYSILTTKNAGQGLNSWVVKSHGGSINTTVDIFTLPPGIYHCEASTPISSNYPISEDRATIEIFGQYRTGTNEIAADGYQKGYWTIRVTYAGGKQYMIQRYWDNWTSWRHIYNQESLIYNATEPSNKYEGRIWLKPIN